MVHCKLLRYVGGSNEPYLESLKTKITDTNQFVECTATLQSATSLKCLDIDLCSHCLIELLSESNKPYTGPFAKGLAGNTRLANFALHVVHTHVTEDDQHRQQLQAILAQPDILADLAAVYQLRKLETLTLAGLTFIMDNAPEEISLPELKYLTLDGVSMASTRSTNALKSLIGSCRLMSLVIVHAPSTSDGLAGVIEGCAEAKNLELLQVLDLSHNHLSRAHTNMVFMAILRFCSKINKLYLQGNRGLDVTAVPRLPSKSKLTLLEVSDVSFEVTERLVQTASVAGPLSELRSIVVRQLTSEGPIVKDSLDRFCAALKAKSVLERLLIVPEGSFWPLTYHGLGFNPQNMGPDEDLWNGAVEWIEALGKGLKENGSLTKFYLAGVSDFQRFHSNDQIATRIIEGASRIVDLAPTTEELAF